VEKTNETPFPFQINEKSWNISILTHNHREVQQHVASIQREEIPRQGISIFFSHSRSYRQRIVKLIFYTWLVKLNLFLAISYLLFCRIQHIRFLFSLMGFCSFFRSPSSFNGSTFLMLHTLLNIKTRFLRVQDSVDYEIFILHLRCSSCSGKWTAFNKISFLRRFCMEIHKKAKMRGRHKPITKQTQFQGSSKASNRFPTQWGKNAWKNYENTTNSIRMLIRPLISFLFLHSFAAMG
jgi:hypothetical protein